MTDTLPWFEYTYVDIKKSLARLGMDIDTIAFAGFGHSDDYVALTGVYKYRTGSLMNTRRYSPDDPELLTIAKRLHGLQLINYFQVFSIIAPNKLKTNRIDRAPLPDTISEMQIIMDMIKTWILNQLERDYRSL